ncbi:hypothetical protein [Actinocorallia longicatena]|uniref:META domain-containing protein n=1 Tax=Actinocorallia longicatena TaxID=111803 RepID=A0ABP6Q0Z4_9ACTN
MPIASGLILIGGAYAVSASGEWSAPMRDARVWVDADQRTLLVSGTGSACDTDADLRLTETAVAVRIEITRHGTEQDCQAVGFVRTFKITLRGPLGTRRVAGFNDLDLVRLDQRPDERTNAIPVKVFSAPHPYVPGPSRPPVLPERESVWVDPSGTVVSLVEPGAPCGGTVTVRVFQWPKTLKIALKRTGRTEPCPASRLPVLYRIALQKPVGGRSLVGADGAPLPRLESPPELSEAGQFKIIYR